VENQIRTKVRVELELAEGYQTDIIFYVINKKLLRDKSVVAKIIDWELGLG
jgi:hypothetical protein